MFKPISLAICNIHLKVSLIQCDWVRHLLPNFHLIKFPRFMPDERVGDSAKHILDVLSLCRTEQLEPFQCPIHYLDNPEFSSKEADFFTQTKGQPQEKIRFH